MHHFHIPLQSGSDRILHLMCRRYTTARFAERIAAVRRAMPDAFIGIDDRRVSGRDGRPISVPRTNCFEGLEPALPAYFPFSERPVRRRSVCPARCRRRSPRAVAQLEALCFWLHGAAAPGPKAARTRCCSKSTMRGGMMFGYTGNYRRVKAPYDRSRINTICRVRLEDGRILRPEG